MPVFHDFPASNSAKHAFRFSQHLSPSGSPEAQPGARHSPVPGPDPTDPTDPRFGLCRATIRTFPDTPRPKTGCAPRSPTHHGPKPGAPLGLLPQARAAVGSADPSPGALYVLQSLMPVFHDFPTSNSAKHAFRLSQRPTQPGAPDRYPARTPRIPVLGCAVPQFARFLTHHGPKPDVPLGARHTTAQNRMYPSEPDTPRPETAQVSAPTHWPQHPIPPTLYVLQSLMPVFHDFPASNSAKRGEVAPRARGGSNTQSETPGTVHDELVPGATRSQNAFQITPRLRRAPPQSIPQGAHFPSSQSLQGRPTC